MPMPLARDSRDATLTITGKETEKRTVVQESAFSIADHFVTKDSKEQAENKHVEVIRGYDPSV